MKIIAYSFLGMVMLLCLGSVLLFTGFALFWLRPLWGSQTPEDWDSILEEGRGESL